MATQILGDKPHPDLAEPTAETTPAHKPPPDPPTLQELIAQFEADGKWRGRMQGHYLVHTVYTPNPAYPGDRTTTSEHPPHPARYGPWQGCGAEPSDTAKAAWAHYDTPEAHEDLRLMYVEYIASMQDTWAHSEAYYAAKGLPIEYAQRRTLQSWGYPPETENAGVPGPDPGPPADPAQTTTPCARPPDERKM
jgi:hypothetical protein